MADSSCFLLQGCCFHSIIPGFMLLGGDIVHGDGAGGRSIYGPSFADESFQLEHVGPGIVTMVETPARCARIC